MELSTKLHKNIHHAIIEAITLVGIASIRATYAGSGDQGDAFEIELLNGDGETVTLPQDIIVNYMEESPVWNSDTMEFVTVPKEKSSNLRTAIEDACWAAVSTSGNDDWENNEGGYGTYTVSATGQATLVHTNNCQDVSSSEEHELDLSHETLSEDIARIVSMLTLHHVESIRVEYDGSGDSGDITEFTVEAQSESEFDEDVVLIENYPVLVNSFEEGKWISTTTLQSVTVATAVEELLDKVINYYGNGGYENNEGGYGSLTINADGTADYRHGNYETAGDATEYDLLESESEEEVAA